MREYEDGPSQTDEGGTKTEASREGGDKKTAPDDSHRGKGKDGSFP